MKSIMQTEKECYITHDIHNLHKHHIFAGGLRQVSERYGFWVYLRADWHNMSNYGVHFDIELDRRLKRDCQQKFEETHSREEFLQIIGRNFIDD